MELAGSSCRGGSERVTDWTLDAAHADISEGEKVWWADLEYAPRSVWMVETSGEIVRIH